MRVDWRAHHERQDEAREEADQMARFDGSSGCEIKADLDESSRQYTHHRYDSPPAL